MSRWCRLYLLALSLLLCAGCAGLGAPSPLPAAPGSGLLPALDSLDSLRSVSAEQQLSIDPQAPLLAANSSNAGAGLDLGPQAGEIAWALYRVDIGALGIAAGDLRNIQLSGTGELWLLLADYSDQRWHTSAALSAGAATGDFSLLTDPLSDDGYAYFVVLAPSNAVGHIDSLTLNYGAPANTFYVAVPQQGGDDANDGSFDNPWATLQHAADMVVPDSLVIVRPGSYKGFKLDHGGEDGAPIAFRGEPGASINSSAQGSSDGIRIELNGDAAGFVTIEGFELLGLPGSGIVAFGSGTPSLQNIQLLRNTCSGMQGPGIVLGEAYDSLIEGNTCSDSQTSVGMSLGFSGDRNTVRGNVSAGNWGAGILVGNDPLEGGDARSSQWLIEGNICHDNAVLSTSIGGMGLIGAEQCEVRNNLLYNNFAGLVLFAHEGAVSTGNRIVNNTIFQDENSRACIVLRNDSTGNLLFNNILLHDTNDWPAIDIDSSSLPGFDSDYNIVSNWIETEEQGKLTLAQWQALGLRDAHSRLGASINLFVSKIENNYHLKDGALAIDAALAEFAPQHDLDGLLRTAGLAPDCGCYEKAGP